MKTYLVHIRPAADGSLPPDLWEPVVADTEFDAIASLLKTQTELPAVAHVLLFGVPGRTVCATHAHTLTYIREAI